jgi:hypothetical protein
MNLATQGNRTNRPGHFDAQAFDPRHSAEAGQGWQSLDFLEQRAHLGPFSAAFAIRLPHFALKNLNGGKLNKSNQGIITLWTTMGP